MRAAIDHLVFDLDGTLTDPREGIVRCFVHALAQLGASPPLAQALERYIGGGLREVFAELLATDDAGRVEQAVSLYRERFGSVGLFENVPYPSVHATLELLCGSGFRIWLCTSKPRVFARRILEHFELARFFSGVYGCELDGRWSDKAELLAHLLQRESIAPGSAIMIGDRFHDVRAARSNGLPCIGVLYGFGDAGELQAAGASATCEQVGDLPRVIAALAPGRVRAIGA